MEIRFAGHALEQMRERGASPTEVRKAVEDAESAGRQVANKVAGRFEAATIVDYGGIRGGRFYPRKRIWVVYEPMDDHLLVVTVVTQFGGWADAD